MMGRSSLAHRTPLIMVFLSLVRAIKSCVKNAKDAGKIKAINKAKDFVPKLIRKAWNAYDDYNAVKEKGSDIQNAIPKDD